VKPIRKSTRALLGMETPPPLLSRDPARSKVFTIFVSGLSIEKFNPARFVFAKNRTTTESGVLKISIMAWNFTRTL
jgi:hypothetical protein